MAVLLDELPTEIIHNIVTYAIGTSPRTGVSLKGTNRCLCEAVQTIRNRRRTYKLTKQWKLRDFDGDNLSIIEPINHLTIEAPTNHSGHLKDATELVSLISKVRNLKTFTWNAGPLHIDILNALTQHHISCDLRIFNWWRSDRSLDHLSDSEIALANFKNLTHLRVVTKDYDDSDYQRSATANIWFIFRQLVGTSPRLQFASWLGNIVDRYDEVPEDPNLTRSRSDSLKTLAIDCPGFVLSLSMLQGISEFVELSNIESLRFTRGLPQLDYFQNAPTLLPNLKNVSLNFSGSLDPSILKAATQYFQTCSPLELLSLWGWRNVITIADLVERHGSALKVLTLHQRDDDPHFSKRDVMTLTEIKLLTSSCLHLTDLTIDLNSENGKYDLNSEPFNKEFLGVVADKMPPLRRIQLYLDTDELYQALRIATLDDSNPIFRTRHANEFEEDLAYIQLRREGLTSMIEPYATAVWKLFYGQHTTGDRQVDLKFGNWESRVQQFSALEDPRAFCEVKPHERDDRKGDYVVKTKLWSRYKSGGV